MKPKTTNAVKAYLSSIGRKGGRSGTREDKVRAARTRWDRQKKTETANQKSE